MFPLVRRLLFGQPLETARQKHERLPKFLALPVFASDALSSNAYATEEILLAFAVGARQRTRDRGVADSQRRVRRRAPHRVLLRYPGDDRAHPDTGSQHGIPGLPPAQLHTRAGSFRPQAAREHRRPAGILERHTDAEPSAAKAKAVRVEVLLSDKRIRRNYDPDSGGCDSVDEVRRRAKDTGSPVRTPVVPLAHRRLYGTAMVLLVIPMLVLLFDKMHQHYITLGNQLRPAETDPADLPEPHRDRGAAGVRARQVVA